MSNKWMQELDRQVLAKTAHTFLLHGNVADDVLLEGHFMRPYKVFQKISSLAPSGIVTFFNFASGLRFATDEMKDVFLEFIIKPFSDRAPGEWTPESYFEEYKRSLPHVLDWLDVLLVKSWEDVMAWAKKSTNVSETTKKYLAEREPHAEGVPFAAVIFEYQESKTPPESSTGSSALDRRVVETFQWWAQLPEIAKTSNVIVLISNFLANVAPALHDPTRGIVPIEVPLPDRDEQKETLDAFVTQGIFVPVTKQDEDGWRKEESLEELARLTSGLSRVELKQVFKEARARGEELTLSMLFKKKTEIIEARLGDIVRIMRPPWGWESIGGMDDRVLMGMMWAEAMRRGNIARLPKGGILLMGAPGTGKTVFAEAMAHELDIPFIEVMNTFNQFVGVSEQNMQNLIDTAWAMRPCVLFFDEIEQLLLPRGSVYHGDSGVFARSSRMLMQFFSDPKIHGQVLIFGLTNRPDLLDPAMFRTGRIGAKIPFLIPSRDQRLSIWKALLRKEQIRLGLMAIDLDVSLVVEDGKLLEELSDMCDFWENEDGMLVCGPPDKDIAKKEDQWIPMTGAQMEHVVGLALQPMLSQKDKEKLRRLTSKEERARFMLEKFPMESRYVLTGEALKSAMRRYLPAENIQAYREMDDLALLSVDDEELIPEAYRVRARKLRVMASRRRS